MPEIPSSLAAALAGRYAIERELGAGGMATVYLAYDARHDRKVAIKVLQPDLAASIGSERFLAEIRTTARLAHPNILPLFDSGDARVAVGQSFLYYVMPLMTGESLRDRLDREKQLDVDEAVRVTHEVADALAYAHANGVIHRDVKPENILLQSGHALVTDFGIARPPSPEGAGRMTQVGMALGTPLYMSPEQAAGDPQLDGRSDLYSLACVAYEMLTGSAPFNGPTTESILVQRFTQAPPRTTAKRSAVPRHVDGALYRAMSRDRDERFATMEDFVDALQTPRAPVAPADAARSVAVLPFANMSANPEDEYFGDGMADEIISALAQVPGLRVAARTSAFSFKGKGDDLRVVGEKLDVGTVLEGSVRRAGNRVRITAQLINVADGYHLWSERYDRELTDIFAIQDEIARAIATRLRVALGGFSPQWDRSLDQLDEHVQRLVKAPTDNLDAYEKYLRARSLTQERGTALLQAIELFEEAVTLDPGFAAAQAHLAHALVLSSFWGVMHPSRMSQRATRAAAEALEHDDQLPAAHSAAALVAMCIRFDREGARAAWARAVELDPNDPEPRLQRAAFDLCYVQGEDEAAIREMHVAIDLDPLSAYAHAQHAVILMFAGYNEEAIVEAIRARELDANSFYAVWALVNAQSTVQGIDEYLPAMSPFLARYGRHPWFLMTLAMSSSRHGRRDLADAFYAELVARSLSEYVQPTVLAIAASRLGRREESLRYLRQAVEIRDPALAAFMLQSKLFDALRSQPEYEEIVRPIGWNSS